MLAALCYISHIQNHGDRVPPRKPRRPRMQMDFSSSQHFTMPMTFRRPNEPAHMFKIFARSITSLRLIVARMVLLFLFLIFIFLPLTLLHSFCWAVCNKLTGIIDARPLGLSIVDIKHSSRIEHVTSITIFLSALIRDASKRRIYGKYGGRWERKKEGDVRRLEILPIFFTFEVDQCWEQ